MPFRRLFKPKIEQVNPVVNIAEWIKANKAAEILYDPSRKQGYWVVQYSSGFYGVSRWDGSKWWIEHKINYRPMTAVRYLGAAFEEGS